MFVVCFSKNSLFACSDLSNIGHAVRVHCFLLRVGEVICQIVLSPSWEKFFSFR